MLISMRKKTNQIKINLLIKNTCLKIQKNFEHWILLLFFSFEKYV